MAETLQELAHELAGCEYGAPETVEYQGVTYRATYEIDQVTSIFDDGDWYDTLAWATTDRGRGPIRPQGFDGAARKIQRNGGDALWWQPPADIINDPENVAAMRSTILDALEFGYHGIVVERCDGTDVYGAPIVAAFASLWGMLGYDREGHAEVIADMLGEVMPEPAPELVMVQNSPDLGPLYVERVRGPR